MRIQKEVKNTLLKNGGKEILVILRQKLSEIVSYNYMENTAGYLAKDILKLRVEGIACFLCPTYSKMG